MWINQRILTQRAFVCKVIVHACALLPVETKKRLAQRFPNKNLTENSTTKTSGIDSYVSSVLILYKDREIDGGKMGRVTACESDESFREQS